MATLIGIGNSMLDRYFPVSDAMLVDMNLAKGSAALLDDTDMESYLNQTPDYTVPGGSVSNSIATASILGTPTTLITSLGDDATGGLYQEALSQEGIQFSTPLVLGAASGFCNVYVTPDGERTMRTYLGASSALNQNHLNIQHLGGVKIAFLEGYLFANPNGIATLSEMAKMLKQQGIKIALTGSATFVIDTFNNEIKDFLKSFVDIFFSNFEEACVLLGHNDLSELSTLCPHNVITNGENGVHVNVDEKLSDFSALNNVQVIDSTGAGDAFAGGYLSAYLKGESIEQCVYVGQKAACYIIQRFGARPNSQLRASIV